ncbi:hypothetical protein Tsubulata_031380, partial [Turnera subulata]
MGKIVGLFHSQPPTMGRIGCMDNLYKSVENLDRNHFRSDTCKPMLLQPRNGAALHCNRLKLKLDNGASLTHYYCRSLGCTSKRHKLLSYYSNATCNCGEAMDREVLQDVDSDSEGVFVKGLQRFFVSDALEVVPASTDAILSKLQVTNILLFSMSSKTALTRTLLENKTMAESSGVNCFDTSSSSMKPKQENHESKGDKSISVRLVISKSKQVVYHAEAGEDFVDLLFSFLTVPLGYIIKEMGSSGGTGSQSQGSICYLYNSVKDLAANAMKSDELKDDLLSPKIPLGFAYENQLLGLEEVDQWYYNSRDCRGHDTLKTDGVVSTCLSIRDPKSPPEGREREGVGFLKEAAMFTVTDDLKITPICPVSSLLLLNKLEVPLSDVGKLTVRIGRGEPTSNNGEYSVENLDLNHFRSDTCKPMLLQPRNGAAHHCNRLKLKLDNGASLTHYYCRSWACTSKGYKLLSYYSNATCHCGDAMDRDVDVVSQEAASDSEGVFVKGLQRFLITNIMRFSMSSKTVLSRILLENKTMAESSGVNYFYTSSPIKPKQENHESKGDGNISVRLVVSKSKQMVCYAEAGEDFVNLLFSFLTVPLGYVLKEMGSSGGNGSQSQGCLSYLYNSVKELDADVMKSDELKEFLLNPKIPVGFAYENQLLGLKEVKLYYNIKSEATDLTIRDPKSSKEPGIKGVGFLKEAAMFTVTDDLKITPISPVTSLLMLNKLKVPLSDVGKLTVQIGREEILDQANSCFRFFKTLEMASTVEGVVRQHPPMRLAPKSRHLEAVNS